MPIPVRFELNPFHQTPHLNQSLCSLWTVVATTMFQRLKRLKDLLGIYLNRRHGLALLERVQASD